MMTNLDNDLAVRLSHMIVSIERDLERVPIESVAFPCPSCLISPSGEYSSKCSQCCSISRMFASERAEHTETLDDDQLPHIDSDEDYFTDPDLMADDLVNKEGMDAYARSDIGQVPEKLLLAGISFPGILDKMGRSVIVYENDTVSKSDIRENDIAKVISCYCNIPARLDRANHGVSILVISPTNSADIDLLDRSLTLVKSCAKVECVFVAWRKRDHHRRRHFRSHKTRSSILSYSKVQYRVLTESDSLEEYMDYAHIPGDCGGLNTHHQMEWIQFYKEVEPFISRCQTCGRRLFKAMSELKSRWSAPTQTRRSLHHQQKFISRFLSDPNVQSIRKEGPETLSRIEERMQQLPNAYDVALNYERCERIYSEILRGVKCLESYADKTREKLRELVRIKALEQETNEVISWLTQNGEDELKLHGDLANNLPAIKQQELNFEKFYFISMRNLDKAGDLLEEAGQCGGNGGTSLKDLARSLKQHLRGFSDRLEDTRERLEDTSRCFYLLDRAYEWALEAMKYMSRVKPDDAQKSSCHHTKQLKQYLMAHPAPTGDHFNEMIQLANKLQNDKLLEQCKVARSRCEETLENIRSIIGPEVPSWVATSTPIGRRRSLPTNQQTLSSQIVAEVDCSCWEPAESAQLQNIQEECFCGGPSSSPSVQRSCSWQYPTEERYEDDDKLSSTDNTTEGSESGTKSSSGDDVEYNESGCGGNGEGGKPIPPVQVNSHLHRNESLHLDTNCGPQTLKKQKTAKLIMREMIQTERDYVKALEYVIENYIPELARDDIPQAVRGQRNVIFGNIEKIFEFHSQHFLRELEGCEQNPFSVGQSFLQHEKKFYLYALYNKNKPKSDSLMSEYGTAFFRAKQLSLGDKMDLASYLLKPVQRMGKYALLLQQLMKACKSDISQLREAEAMVRFQLRHGNDLLAMDSLRECDVNLKEQGRLLRQNEFLVWQGKGKKCLRQVFLFEDLILFSKARRFPDRKNLDLYIYKNSIKTSDIGLTARIADSATKFEIWFRKRKPNDTFTLQSMSEEIKHAWTEELSNLLWRQALKNREMRMQEMSSMGIGNKPCLDIRPSADQISDRSISIDQLSKTAPRFRNSIAVCPAETMRKRPHSVISITSSSSSGASSAGSSIGEHRQSTSHCSSAESGIVPDWSNTISTNSSITSADSSQHHMTVKL